MKKLTWKDITVKKFQKITAVSFDNSLTENEQTIAMIAIVFDMSIDEVRDLPLSTFKKMSSQVDKVFDTFSMDKPVKNFAVKNRIYRIVYDLNKLPVKNSEEIQRLTSGITDFSKIHLTMACICERVTWYGKKIDVKPEEIQQDILNAPIKPIASALNYISRNHFKQMEAYN